MASSYSTPPEMENEFNRNMARIQRNSEAYDKLTARLFKERDNLDRARRTAQRVTRALGRNPDYLPEAYGDDVISDDPEKMLKAALDALSGAACCIDYALQQIENRALFLTLSECGGAR